MGELGKALLSPLGLFLFLALFGMGVRKLRSVAIATGCLNLLFFSLPMVANSLILSLESRHPPFLLSTIPETEWALLLGGGLSTTGEGFSRSELSSSGDRLALAAELYANQKIKRILITSGATNDHQSEAKQTAVRLQGWGIPISAIVIEENSSNTVENARFTRPLLAGFESQPSLLVTSALHLPRARALFCAQGINVTGVAANHWVRPEKTIGWTDWIPNATSLNGSTRALTEYVGIAYYALRGRLAIDTLNYDQSCVRSQA